MGATVALAPAENWQENVDFLAIAKFSASQILFASVSKYSILSNKRAGWNKVCRLENLAKFGNFENLKLNWMGLKYF